MFHDNAARIVGLLMIQNIMYSFNMVENIKIKYYMQYN